MSSITFLSTILAYSCVMVSEACPSILLTVSMGMPCDSVIVVANVCRAMWNIHGKASDSEQVKIKRNPLGISDISVFCKVEKMQTATEY